MKQPIYEKDTILSEGHWRSESYAQRMTNETWKQILLHDDDQITFEGRVRRLVAKRLGYGVVEVSKEKRNK